MVNIIFVDMDGVLCDFEKRWVEKFNRSPKSSREHKEFSGDWNSFVADREFESLPWFRDAELLVKYLNGIPVRKHILSSTGGEKYYDEISEQKSKWLTDRGIDWGRTFITSRKLKKDYAVPDSLLIDDVVEVVDSFSSYGGYSILHKHFPETMSLVEIYTRVMM